MLLRDIRKGDDPQIAAVLGVIGDVVPDVLILTDFDFDYDQMALAAFADVAGFPHFFSAPPNSGMPTGLDLDGNGRLGEARDMQGYGRFAGDAGMAVLSRFEIDRAGVRTLSDLLWRDLPGATLPETMSDEVAAVQRLSTTGHWIVPISAPDGMLTILMSSHTPPVFDGPEDRNGLRNADELALWMAVLNGTYGDVPSEFVIVGNLNLDPVDGEGLSSKLRIFLDDPRLQDPLPQSDGGRFAADPSHQGVPSLDTADWSDAGPGNLRVSYVLPDADWTVTSAGVFWPAPGEPKAPLLGDDGTAAGPHRLVWVDIRR